MKTTITRRQFLSNLGLSVAGSFVLPYLNCSKSVDRPNILCITCEDISPYLGCYGDKVAKTPNLDQLAREGVRFTNVYSVSGVCAPSRAALITGMYPSAIGANHMRTNRKGLPDNIPPYEAVPPIGVKCYTEYLRAAGYFCSNNAKTDYQFQTPITAWDENGRHAHWRNRPNDMPFFSIFNFATTHESQVWKRTDEPELISPEDVQLPPYYPDTPEVRKDVARVYSNISVMDRQGGELIDLLEQDGLLDNTIVIFYSDHGGPLPRGKRELYDSGLKVPMIIRFPNEKFSGTVKDELISFIDIPATILSLAGVKIPETMHGQAFWGGQEAEPRKHIFAARDRMDGHYDIRRAVRDKRFKYIRNYRPEVTAYQEIEYRKQMGLMKELLRLRDEGKLNKDQMRWFRRMKEKEELYDTVNDPHELSNLAIDPKFQTELIRLRQVHEQWMKEIGDKGLKSEKELVLSMWPSGKQPVTQSPEIKIKNGKIKITCNTAGASIAYQINGKGFSKDHWFLYTKPFEIQQNDSVSAVAIRIGFKQSEIVTKN